MLPHDVVLRTATRADVDSALSDGIVVDAEWNGAPAWALTDVAESEELLADGLAVLAAENRLAVVAGPDPAGRRLAVARATGGSVPAVIVDEAHTVGLDEVLGAVEDLPEEAVLVLSLDNALPLAAVTGAVALDVAASGVCPVLVGDSERDDRALGVQRASVATGRWAATPADDRSLVIVPVASPEEALVRAGQLVSTSIPRAFGTAAGEVAVVVPEPSGPVGVEPLRAAVGDAAEVVPVGALGDRTWRGVVLVLPGVATGAVTRASIYAGLRAGREHVSLVHGLGPDGLASVVSSTTDRPRRTRLAALLRDS